MSDIQVIIPLSLLAAADSLSAEDVLKHIQKLLTQQEKQHDLSMVVNTINNLGMEIHSALECDDQILKHKTLREVANQLTMFHL